MRILLYICIVLGVLLPSSVVYISANQEVAHFKPLKEHIYIRPEPLPTSMPTVEPEPIPLPVISTPEPTTENIPLPTALPTPTPFCGYCEGGLTITYMRWWEGTYYTCQTAKPLQNKEQVYQFILADKTDEVRQEGWNCAYYAAGVVNNASQFGIKAMIVHVTFEGCSSHAAVLFPTVEDGDVYMDSQTSDWYCFVGDNSWTEVDMDSGWSWNATYTSIIQY